MSDAQRYSKRLCLIKYELDTMHVFMFENELLLSVGFLQNRLLASSFL